MSVRRSILTLALLGAAGFMAFYIARGTRLYSPPEGAYALAFENAVVWTGAGEVLERATIVTRGDRIDCIGECSVPATARRVDVGGKAVVPGLIDLHVSFYHPTGDRAGDGSYTWAIPIWHGPRQRPEVRRAFHEAGVTTIRSIGDPLPGIFDLRHRLQEQLSGPRLFFAAPYLTAPGGHPISTVFRGTGPLANLTARQLTSVEQTTAELAGLEPFEVDGLLLVYEQPAPDGDPTCRPPRLPLEVADAVVGQARERDLWLAVQTATAADFDWALQRGADTIEFGLPTEASLSEGQLAALSGFGGVVVPHLAYREALSTQGTFGFGFDLSREQCPALLRDSGTPPSFLAALRDAGVSIGAGSRALGETMQHGVSLLRELELLVESGLTDEEALAAATRVGGAALRQPDLGVLRAGAYADFLVIDGRPWTQIRDLRRVERVVQGGVEVVTATAD